MIVSMVGIIQDVLLENKYVVVFKKGNFEGVINACKQSYVVTLQMITDFYQMKGIVYIYNFNLQRQFGNMKLQLVSSCF